MRRRPLALRVPRKRHEGWHLVSEVKGDNLAAGRKVLIIYQSSLAACGVGTWVEALAGELEQRQWDVTVGLAWGATFHDPRRVERFRPKLKTVWMDGRTGTEEGCIRGIERAIRQVKPDVVILTLIDAAFEAVRRLRYRGHNFRLIACNQNNFPQHAARFVQNRDVVDLAVCVGRVCADGLSRIPGGFSAERVRHIPNGIPIPESPPRDRTKATNRVGYAARLCGDPNKNASDLFPFFRALTRMHETAELWVAGEGELSAQVRLLEDEYPGRVKYFGRLSQADLYRNFYPHLDVFLNFAPYEGWPQSIAEAMAHGVIPVVSEYFGIHSEAVVRNNDTGEIFPVYDADRAAEIVAELLRDLERRRRMSENAAAEMRQGFSTEHLGQRWDQALNDALSLPGLTRPPRPMSLDRRGRLGLKETAIETIRGWLGRRFVHQSAGEEWRNFHCLDERLVAQAAAALKEQEDAARRAAADGVASGATGLR